MLNLKNFDGAVLDLGLPKVDGQTVPRQRMPALQLLRKLADVVAREHSLNPFCQAGAKSRTQRVGHTPLPAR